MDCAWPIKSRPEFRKFLIRMINFQDSDSQLRSRKARYYERPCPTICTVTQMGAVDNFPQQRREISDALIEWLDTALLKKR
jgi:hypothetical protein